jgi:hypothetical protein
VVAGAKEELVGHAAGPRAAGAAPGCP